MDETTKSGLIRYKKHTKICVYICRYTLGCNFCRGVVKGRRAGYLPRVPPTIYQKYLCYATELLFDVRSEIFSTWNVGEKQKIHKLRKTQQSLLKLYNQSWSSLHHIQITDFYLTSRKIFHVPKSDAILSSYLHIFRRLLIQHTGVVFIYFT